ncbi:MAG: hypothetical protein JWQ35_2271 [Bacteriovoracaceae bacterium]|nr:hypothetical protein [Bacteriovoracaceae bacterium]
MWCFRKIALALPFAIGSISAADLKSAPIKCAFILSDLELRQSIYFSTGRKRFKTEDWFTYYKDVEAVRHLDGMPPRKEDALLQNTLLHLLKTSYGFIPETEMRSLRALILDFQAQGGKFVIDRNSDPKVGYSASFTVSTKGQLYLQIPYVALLGASAGIERNREYLFGSLVHELRHYVSYIRIAKNLAVRGQPKIKAKEYMIRLDANHPESYINHVAQLEDEARNIERKLAPKRGDENLGKFVYSRMQPLQRWISFYSTEKGENALASIGSDSRTIRMVDAVVEELLQFLFYHLDRGSLPSSLKWCLRGYLTDLKIDVKKFGLEYFIKTAVDDTFSDIHDRLSEERKNVLSELISSRLLLQRRKLEGLIQSILNQHPNLKPYGEP